MTLPKGTAAVGRAHPVFVAQEQRGTRVIIAALCLHRRRCPSAVVDGGLLMHLDGLALRDEAAAVQFDLRQLCPDGCGQSWHTFPSWTAAQQWLATGCPGGDVPAPAC